MGYAWDIGCFGKLQSRWLLPMKSKVYNTTDTHTYTHFRCVFAVCSMRHYIYISACCYIYSPDFVPLLTMPPPPPPSTIPLKILPSLQRN